MSQDFQYDMDSTKEAQQVGGFGPLPSDIYAMRVTDPELGESKNGNLQVKFKWQVEGGDYAGRTVFDQITFTPKTGPFVLAYMRALGLERPTGKINAQALAEHIALKIDGRLAKVTLGLRPGKPDDLTGEVRMFNEVVNVQPYGAGNVAATPRDTLSADELADQDVPF